ncbi:class F sortase [Nocardioides alcanivorans]|uniref:class F sortase n=1 Tax=Nocardioides alcanivorans TaxID=2897352 RepID=UPI001F327D87|nr:class F sortase [Nocardioides alcanivorans]
MTGREDTGKRGSQALVVFVVVMLALAVGLGWAHWRSGDDTGDRYVTTDLDGREVVWDQRPDPQGAAVRSTGERFRAPRQDLSVPLESAVTVNGVINPPALTAAYWYRDFGPPGGLATTVVAMHAVRGGRGPGNALLRLDETSGQAQVLVERGDLLIVGASRYRVTRTLVASKRETARDRRIWDDDHEGRLVVVTCLLDPDVPLETQENLVVLARLQPAGQHR